MFKTRFISMLVLLLMTATGAWATITVTWNNDDITGSGNSFTKDGVTITAGMINFVLKDFYQGGTFTTTLGNFTKIEVTADDVYDVSGTGWSGSDTKKTWTGNASSVPFSGAIYGNGAGNTKSVFTIEPATVAVTGVTLAPTSATLTLGETETVTLIPTVLPGDATDKSVTWSSSNEAVATVTDGVVTAVAAGEATITVTTTDGAKTATCAVTVAAPAASTYTVTLKEGTDDATSWTIVPDEATTTGVAAGTEVKATYGGTKKVKSVKAKKKASAAGPTAYTLAESTQGMIVGTDGKAYDVADKDNLPTGVTAAGMVAYKSGSNGLVIALADEASTMNWSTANGASGAAAHTPTVTGQTWKLPSQAEWQQMFSANGGNQNSYTGLNTALAAAGGDSGKLREGAMYWSSSEINPGVFAYSVYLFNGDAYCNSDLEFIEYEVRACLAF